MTRLPQFSLRTLLVLTAIVALALVYVLRIREVESQTASKVYLRTALNPDGSKTTVRIIGNDVYQVVCVIVEQEFPGVHPEALVSNNFRSSWSHDGEDDTNGVWINGQKQSLKNGIFVAHLTNQSPPVIRRLPRNSASQLLVDFQTFQDLSLFIEKHLPPQQMPALTKHNEPN